MNLTLFHSPGTRSIRVRWLLEELNLPYELKSIVYDGAYFASDEYRQINPMGKVPALYDGDTLLVESIAIMEYLIHRYGSGSMGVASDHSEYAEYLQWLHMPESGMANYIAVSFGNSFNRDPYRVSKEYDAYCRFQITKALDMLENQLQDREYILKSGFSAADISLGYTLFFAKTCTGTQFTDVVKEYYGRLMARPAAQKALSDLKSQN
ncbi:MAG: glutathione S-transferase family protein [Pseudomonadota bacterium]